MKLTDFKDADAIRVIADLLPHVGNIAKNSAVEKARKGSMMEFAATLLKENPSDVLAMLAILNNQAPAEYHCNAANVIMDVFSMISDPALLELFGLPTRTQTTSGSASANTEDTEA